MHFHELLARLREDAKGRGVPIYLVGGCVRDGLLGRPLADVDLAITGDAMAYARSLAGSLGATYVPLGERHGTGRIVLASAPEGVQQIDCSSLQGGIQEDLARRDFTVDAMAVDLASFAGEWSCAAIVDPWGGKADLEKHRLQMVRPEAFDADPLRLMRAVRLVAERDFSLEERTAVAIRERAPQLRACAPERIREELCRILTTEGTATWIELLDSLGLLATVFPELAIGKGVTQPKEHYWEVFSHQVETVAAAEAVVERRISPKLGKRRYLAAVLECSPWHPALEGYFEEKQETLPRAALLKLAALLHDVAKPATKTFETTGRMRFFGHAELGAEMVQGMLTRLRFSGHQVRAVTQMVAYHLRPGQWSDGSVPTPRALYRYFRDLGETALDTVFLNVADHLAARGPALDLQRWRQHVEITNQVLAHYFTQQERTLPLRLLTGSDIMEVFGLGPGPLIGKLLGLIQEARAEEQVQTREQALALVAEALSKERSESQEALAKTVH